MGLAVEILGLVIFLGAHVFVTRRNERAVLVARIGEWPYRGLFSLVSIIGIGLIAYGFATYRAAGLITVWNPPLWTRHIVIALMWPASIMIAAAYIPGNIKRVLKHPMLVGVKTWAFAHLCANGDLGGIILFGSFLAWAVYDRITLEASHRSRRPADPGRRRQKRPHCHRRRHPYLSGARLGIPSDRRRPAGIWNGGVRPIARSEQQPDQNRVMSVQNEIRRLTAPDILARKGGEPIVCLTSYHAHTARIVDAHCDVILVGDSLGMVMHGLETTVPVTLDMMILQGHAVMRGSKRALVTVDLPFGSYEASKEQAFASAARVLKETGCGAIKIEGGRRMAETIAFLVERGVPVMAHVGLTPQAINTIGSFRAQGRDESDWAPIEADARAVSDAGAFSVVLEAIAEPLGRRITGANPDPDHRHRRQRRLRRPSAGARGHARPVAAGAEIRQALRRTRALDRARGQKLCRRGSGADFSGRRPRLPDAAERRPQAR